jgi:hypothetical protein
MMMPRSSARAEHGYTVTTGPLTPAVQARFVAAWNTLLAHLRDHPEQLENHEKGVTCEDVIETAIPS